MCIEQCTGRNYDSRHTYVNKRHSTETPNELYYNQEQNPPLSVRLWTLPDVHQYHSLLPVPDSIVERVENVPGQTMLRTLLDSS